jgi:YHS domain-containing protein
MIALFMIACSEFSYAGDFFEQDGMAIAGYDPIVYFTDMKATHGIKEISAEYKGSVFLFTSAENRDKFLSSPELYVPQFNGFCAYGVAGGYKAKIDPLAFSVIGGKLYLNYNTEVQSKWTKDVNHYISKAENEWSEVIKQSKVYK